MRYIKLIACFGLFLMSFALVNPVQHTEHPDRSEPVIAANDFAGTQLALQYLDRKTIGFAQAVNQLSGQIGRLDSSDPGSVTRAKTALSECRIRYKKISFFLDYFYPQSGKLYNGPAKKELEEPYMEYEDPQGLQCIEAGLSDPHPVRRKTDMENLVLVMKESASDLLPVYQTLSVHTSQIMESLHLELIRIMCLYITGYDAPFLKTGIREAESSLESIDSILTIYRDISKWKEPSLDILIKKTENYLKENRSFDSFNRLAFLTVYALPLEKKLEKFILENGWELHSAKYLNYRAGHLFQREVIPVQNAGTADMILLGKTLFLEKALSGNGSRSCASCHQPEKYFTDQLSRNLSMSRRASLKRNTPGLFYAAYQSAQFWDGRDSSLHDQIHDVLTDQNEMGGTVQGIERSISTNESYRLAFQKVFGKNRDTITINEIQSALQAYLESLNPMSSSFDQYMAGDHYAMTPEQQDGFNLFMGKAACGTCHFAPLFNGSTPPYYNHTEYEILGVPRSGDFNKKTPDTDAGRYNMYPVDIYRGAFKTPTLRNVAKTFPYMHNGSMHTLYDVLDFYNRGGGSGLGLNIPDQTLSKNKLHLTQTEIGHIIAFLNALTDHEH